jgi:hypothetical protein
VQYWSLSQHRPSQHASAQTVGLPSASSQMRLLSTQTELSKQVSSL